MPQSIWQTTRRAAKTPMKQAKLLQVFKKCEIQIHQLFTDSAQGLFIRSGNHL